MINQELQLLIYSYVYPLDEMLQVFENDLKTTDLLIMRYYQLPSLSTAISWRYKNVIKYLITHGHEFTEDAHITCLIHISDIEFFEWLYAHDIKFSQRAIEIVVRTAKCEKYKFFVSKGHQITYTDLSQALGGYYNYRELLEYDAFQGYFTGNIDEAFDLYKDMLIYILEAGIKPSEQDYDVAEMRRDTQMMELLKGTFI